MNLIVTCPRHFEEDAADEISGILDGMGADLTVQKSRFSGILMVDAKISPAAVSRHIRERIHDEPWSVRYILRTIPVQKWIATDMEQIVAESQILAGTIRADEKYRVTVEKRDSEISSRDIISRIADLMENEVSLEAPDRIILVEILGDHTGLSVISADDILSVEREKRRISE